MSDQEYKKTEANDIQESMVKLFLQDLQKALTKIEASWSEKKYSLIRTELKLIATSAKIAHIFKLETMILAVIHKVFLLENPGKNELQLIDDLLKKLNAYAKMDPAEFLNSLQEENKHESVSKQVKSIHEELEQDHLTETVADPALMDLFSMEAETQTVELNRGLLALEQNKEDHNSCQTLMRAAHSLKGGAKIVGLDELVAMAHALEDCFSGLVEGKINLTEDLLDDLFNTVDFFTSVTKIPSHSQKKFLQDQKEEIQLLLDRLMQSKDSKEKKKTSLYKILEKEEKEIKTPRVGAAINPYQDRVLRVNSSSLNRLMGIAGESLVESLWLEPFGEALTNLKHTHNEIARDVGQLRESLKSENVNEKVNHFLSDLQHQVSICRQSIDSRLSELEMFIRRHVRLSERLYGEVIDIRMRPILDGIKAFPRFVRDLGKQLEKKVQLKINGELTPVDRDILERLEAPLNHLIRNAVDHGIETPEERERAGKDPEGTITLDASHRGGMLHIVISDDGIGIDTKALRDKIVKAKHVNEDVVNNFSDAELFDFLFLPGFTTSDEVTEISGRGVGLNVVLTTIQEVGGTIKTSSELGKGMSFHLQLPLTLSVIRSLIVKIAGEPYAFPLSRIDRSLTISAERIETIENCQYIRVQKDNIGLIPATKVLGFEEDMQHEDTLSIVMLEDKMNKYGVVVDSFVGEKDLVVQEIDPLLKKIPGISSGGFMENGDPLLIIDVEDMLRSVDKILSGYKPKVVSQKQQTETPHPVKKILVIDDSITVREVESRLLSNKGYEVQTAVDGVDGWNAVRIGNFDLVITDVDMPRMNGIELVKAIKGDERLKNIPILIVSYKEREEDRKMGLEAGADYYLTKSSFHDETLADVVHELIGEPITTRKNS